MTGSPLAAEMKSTMAAATALRNSIRATDLCRRSHCRASLQFDAGGLHDCVPALDVLLEQGACSLRPRTHRLDADVEQAVMHFDCAERSRVGIVQFVDDCVGRSLGDREHVPDRRVEIDNSLFAERRREADLGVTTESDRSIRSLAFLTCRRFERVLVVPEGHPLLAVDRVTLADIAQYPLVAYEQAFTGRRLVERAFEQAGLSPKVALSAIDADVIKACVERGLGVAILSEVTFDPSRDVRLRAIKLGALVAPSITSVAVRHRRLRGYEYDFISMCSLDWTRARVDGVLSRRD